MSASAVLIADDLEIFLEVAKAFLGQRGFEVLTAANGTKALELARARRPRLILLDLVMPEMDGAAACVAMRRDPSLAFTPILIMSATGSAEIRDRCLKSGCTNFVVKPRKAAEFLNIIAQILSVRERRLTRTTVIFHEVAPTEGRQLVGMAGNLSGTGMLLLTDKPVRAGSALQLEFVVPNTQHTIKAQGKVLRVSQNSEGTYGAGLHFIDLGPAEQKLIVDFVSS
jgi:CheY-like chemotaxis protein